jgi:hypothetical protein
MIDQQMGNSLLAASISTRLPLRRWSITVKEKMRRLAAESQAPGDEVFQRRPMLRFPMWTNLASPLCLDPADRIAI